MKAKHLIVLGAAVALLFWGKTLAQSQDQQSQNPNPTTQSQPSGQQEQPNAPATPQGQTTNPPETGTAASQQQPQAGQQPEAGQAQAKAEKPKHWTGSLVDAACVDKVMSGQSTSSSQPGPAPAVPHFLGEPVQAGQQPTQRPGEMQPGQNQAPMSEQAPDHNPDMSQRQAAQQAKASMMDNAAKQCAPSASTQSFGLVLSSGEVVKFDSQGNSKASEALKEVQVQPGKKVKAKVDYTMGDNGTVQVASVQVKGKKAATAGSSSAAPGGGH